MVCNIIITHRGNPPHLKYVLSQIAHTNPDANIILMGDESNKNCRFTKHVFLKDYWNMANDFAQVYTHLNSTSVEYELFCYQRWFCVYEYMKAHNLEDVFSLDSDVLVYDNLNDLHALLKNYPFAISAKNNLRQAEQNIEKANDIKSEMQNAIQKLNEITETADLYYLFLSKMERYGDQAVKIIQQIIKKHGVDFSVYSRTEQNKLQYACNIMRLLTEALNTAIMTEKGILDAGSLEKFTSLNSQSVTLQEQFYIIYKPSEKELDLLRDQFESLTERYDLGIIGSFDDMRTARIWRNIYSRISNGDVREDDKPVLAIITKFIEYLDWKEFLTA